MGPSTPNIWQPLWRLPRVSGDGPLFDGRIENVPEAAPRERGWARLDLLVVDEVGGCPA